MIAMRRPGKRAAALVADAVVSALAPLLARRSRGEIPSAPRVLVIRCDHIGDAVMATSVLRPLREALRPATIDVLAGPWAAPLFERDPAVDEVLTYATPWWSAARGARLADRLRQWGALPSIIRRIRAGRYDVGIDLRGDLRQITFFLALGGIPIRVSSDRTGGRRLLTHVRPYAPAAHEVERDFTLLECLGITGTPRPELPAPDEPDELSAALRAALFRTAGHRRYAVFALQASEPNRAWPASHAATLASRLYRELGVTSVIVGGADDVAFGRQIGFLARPATPVLDLTGKTSLSETLAIMRGASVTVAVDSGPMHLAAAAGSPVVALFGPGDPRACRPWSSTARVLTTGAPCGCAGGQCDAVTGPGRCMRDLSPSTVLDAVRDLLRERSERTLRHAECSAATSLSP